MNDVTLQFPRKSRLRRWLSGPLRAITVLAALLPIALLGFYSLHVTEGTLRQQVSEENETAATLTAETLRMKLEGDMTLVHTLTQFPGLRDSVRQRDAATVRELLRRLIELNPQIDRAYVLDTQGVLWSDWPEAPESLGKNFSERDYFKGVMQSRAPYVSEVFQRVAEPRPLVVAVGAPITIDSGVEGVLVFQHRAAAMTQWLTHSMKRGDMKSVVLLDQRGTLAAHSGAEVTGDVNTTYASLPQVQRAANGDRQTGEYDDPLAQRRMVATFVPVQIHQGTRWVVIAQQDRERAYAGISKLRTHLLAAIALVGCLAFAAMWVLGQAGERHRRMELELAGKNQQLEESIARQKAAQEELAEERHLFHTLMDNLPDRIYFKDDQSRFLRINASMQELFKAGKVAPQGHTDFDFFDQAHAQAAWEDEQQVMKSGEVIVGKVEREELPDGRVYWVSTTKMPLRDREGKIVGTFGISRDITRLKRMEEELRQTNAQVGQRNEQLQAAMAEEEKAHRALKEAQGQLVQSAKLAGLGQMVAGVAHEINNPLSFVSNNVAVLQRDVAAIDQVLKLYQQGNPVLEKENPELVKQIREFAEQVDLAYLQENLQGLLERSRDGLKRIAQIVKDLRDFARMDRAEIQEVDLNAGIESTVGILRARARKKQVQIDMQLGGLPLVTCNLGKINQVIMNLVANAIDASPDGATVVVKSSFAGDVVTIEVIDQGHGISARHREHLFEPFFTTKPQGEGVGLGLSISYGVVRSHGGTIVVDSEPGKGARFIVTLPRKSAEAVQAKS